MASNIQEAAVRIAGLVIEDNDGPTCDVYIPDRDKVRRRVLGEALADFARAIVDEARAGHARQGDAPDAQCTDEELATALLAAQGLASASPSGERTLLARALLRMKAERDAGLQLPTLAPDALPTVPGMAESDARLRAEMAAKVRPDLAAMSIECPVCRGPMRLDNAGPRGGTWKCDRERCKEIDGSIERIRRQRAALPAFFEANPDLHNCQCHANDDGDCTWERCPQNRDGEPARGGRPCPLYLAHSDDDGR